MNRQERRRAQRRALKHQDYLVRLLSAYMNTLREIPEDLTDDEIDYWRREVNKLFSILNNRWVSYCQTQQLMLDDVFTQNVHEIWQRTKLVQKLKKD